MGRAGLVLLALLAMLQARAVLVKAQGDFADLDPEYDAQPVTEDPAFDPYKERHAAMIDPQVRERGEAGPEPEQVEHFDFDPSEGLTFFVGGGDSECFFQDAKFDGDEISGAFVVASADSHIDLEIKNPAGATIFRRIGDAEGQYRVVPSQAGVHELCFVNSDADGKLVTHVTNTLKSQHPVEREHVNVLAKYASHLDVRLGELESELRLQLIRAERHIKVEDITSKRVVFYGALECVVYLVVCFAQVYYIKSLLDTPRKVRSWV